MYRVTINDNGYEVKPNSTNSLAGTLGGEPYELELKGNPEEGFFTEWSGRTYEVQVLQTHWGDKRLTLAVNNQLLEIHAEDSYDLLLKELGMTQATAGVLNELKAPMPGLVLRLDVQEGDTVEEGQSLLVLEAMKMENVLKCSARARVKKVVCREGVAVSKNDVLLEFEEA